MFLDSFNKMYCRYLLCWLLLLMHRYSIRQLANDESKDNKLTKVRNLFREPELVGTDGNSLILILASIENFHHNQAFKLMKCETNSIKVREKFPTKFEFLLMKPFGKSLMCLPALFADTLLEFSKYC